MSDPVCPEMVTLFYKSALGLPVDPAWAEAAREKQRRMDDEARAEWARYFEAARRGLMP